MSALLPEWESSCRDAIALLGESGSLPTPQMIDVTDAALRKIIQARDGMIVRLRSEPNVPHAGVWRTALNQVNVALSELASIQYPGALDRNHIQVSKSLLETLLSESQTQAKGEMQPLRDPTGHASAAHGEIAVEEHRVDATSPPGEPEVGMAGIEGGIEGA